MLSLCLASATCYQVVVSTRLANQLGYADRVAMDFFGTGYLEVMDVQLTNQNVIAVSPARGMYGIYFTEARVREPQR